MLGHVSHDSTLLPASRSNVRKGVACGSYPSTTAFMTLTVRGINIRRTSALAFLTLGHQAKWRREPSEGAKHSTSRLQYLAQST